jgi:hypothetical protein
VDRASAERLLREREGFVRELIETAPRPPA